jgi:hypothetical protein
MTMWRPSEVVEENVSNFPGIDPQGKRRRSRRGVWRDGIADQTVVTTLEDVRCYRAFERALIGSVDLFLRLSNLDPTLLERLSSYEATLWRQAAQTIWTLEAMRRPQPAFTRRPFRLPDRHFGCREPL